MMFKTPVFHLKLPKTWVKGRYWRNMDLVSFNDIRWFNFLKSRFATFHCSTHTMLFHVVIIRELMYPSFCFLAKLQLHGLWSIGLELNPSLFSSMFFLFTTVNSLFVASLGIRNQRFLFKHGLYIQFLWQLLSIVISRYFQIDPPIWAPFTKSSQFNRAHWCRQRQKAQLLKHVLHCCRHLQDCARTQASRLWL